MAYTAFLHKTKIAVGTGIAGLLAIFANMDTSKAETIVADDDNDDNTEETNIANNSVAAPYSVYYEAKADLDTANQIDTITTQNNNPEFLDGGDKLIFVVNNDKLEVKQPETEIEKKNYTKVLNLVTKFNLLEDKKLTSYVLSCIKKVIEDEELEPGAKNNIIRDFLGSAVGNSTRTLRADGDSEYTQMSITIAKKAGNPMNVDENGIISDTKSIMEQVFAQATRVPLDKLLENPTFSANWNDAKNLKGKSVELAGKKNLTKDQQTMIGMDEYRAFKKLTSTIDINGMRSFLSGYLNDISYMGDEITDDFVSEQYLAAMKEMEKDMGNTAELKPDLLVKVDIDDL